ncbi:MAG: metallophosphoesterase [Oscillospiraceae bacterium]|nr:metallophosphoesterase [Oscillospiraceae bacterium]
MIKILHSADWHLDSPIQGRTAEQTELLRSHLLSLPGKIAAICRQEECDMMLLSGDLFDGEYSADSIRALKNALEEAAVPVFITPGNHDPQSINSPWQKGPWPENVYIFKENTVTGIDLPELGCTVYGGSFTGPESTGMLENFRADCNGIAIGILHGDPTQLRSPYCPVTEQQVKESGLAYLALGHIHKGGQFRAGSTLCAWPGCPMGRGYDEQSEKGVLIATIDGNNASTRFIPLDLPRFYDLEADTDMDASAALGRLLPPAGSEDFYRITLTGESEPLNLAHLQAQYSHFPNLTLRDETVPPTDLWARTGDDTLEGVYFRMLRDALETADEASARQILLAAKISNQILDGREVKLP